ncbi:hypothetical protein DC889_24685 [Vibrio parahaemolyticus]|nr:hypothetical protein [Vibrio parahaemolyticus]
MIRKIMSSEVLKKAIEFANEHVVQLEMQNNYKYHAYSVGLYCSLIELSQSFEVLTRDYVHTGALVLFRSFMEHYVDLKNLRNSESYVDVLDLDNGSSHLKQLKQAKDGNPYFSSLVYLADTEIPRIQEENKKLAEKLGKKKYSVLDKFQLAGMENEYKGLYAYLCSEAHSSLSSIVKRHFRKDDAKDHVELVVHASEPCESDIFYVANMALYLSHAGSLVCEILDSDIKSKFDEHTQSIQNSASKIT